MALIHPTSKEKIDCHAKKPLLESLWEILQKLYHLPKADIDHHDIMNYSCSSATGSGSLL